MTSLSFSVTDIPPDDSEADAVVDSGLSCQTCGVGLVYAGRGRKPRFCDAHKKGASSASTGNQPRKNPRDVEAALAAITAAHDGLSFALMMVSPEAGLSFENSRARLTIQVETILRADPVLAKRIGSMASRGGGGALLLAHIVALVPAGSLVAGQMKAKAAMKREQTDAIYEGDDPDFPGR